jgi:hypothetical protein
VVRGVGCPSRLLGFSPGGLSLSLTGTAKIRTPRARGTPNPSQRNACSYLPMWKPINSGMQASVEATLLGEWPFDSAFSFAMIPA